MGLELLLLLQYLWVEWVRFFFAHNLLPSSPVSYWLREAQINGCIFRVLNPAVRTQSLGPRAWRGLLAAILNVPEAFLEVTPGVSLTRL